MVGNLLRPSRLLFGDLELSYSSIPQAFCTNNSHLQPNPQTLQCGVVKTSVLQEARNLTPAFQEPKAIAQSFAGKPI